MPELAEVEWYRRQWDPAIGEKIAKVEMHATKRVFRQTNTALLKRKLTAARLLSSEARGKRMMFKFSGDNWLGIHLGMTGTLRIETPDFSPGKHDHLVLRQKKRTLVFRDARQFGRARFHHGRGEPDWWRSDVPEIVWPQFNQQFLDAFLKRHERAPIKAVLLLQDGFPGIGNWMADEILWRAGIRPARRAGKLKDRARLVLRETKFVAAKALQITGRTFADPPRDWLIHQRWKPGGICPRHKIPLRRGVIGGRTTVWCTKCQA